MHTGVCLQPSGSGPVLSPEKESSHLLHAGLKGSPRKYLGLKLDIGSAQILQIILGVEVSSSARLSFSSFCSSSKLFSIVETFSNCFASFNFCFLSFPRLFFQRFISARCYFKSKEMSCSYLFLFCSRTVLSLTETALEVL